MSTQCKSCAAEVAKANKEQDLLLCEMALECDRIKEKIRVIREQRYPDLVAGLVEHVRALSPLNDYPVCVSEAERMRSTMMLSAKTRLQTLNRLREDLTLGLSTICGDYCRSAQEHFEAIVEHEHCCRVRVSVTH